MSRRTSQALTRLLDVAASELVQLDAPRSARDAADGQADIQWVRLAAVRPSPHQTRLVHDAAAVEALAADIGADRLLHYPVVRDAPPDAAGDRGPVWTLVSGHRRVEALRVLEGREGVHPDLRRDPETGETLIPVRVMLGDEHLAHRRTIAENLVRESLSSWEHAVALTAYMRQAGAAGEPPSLRKLEGALGVPRSTLEPLVRIGRALTAPVLVAAGLLEPGQGDVRQAEAASLVRLPQTVLDRVARVEGEAARAEAFRAALGRPLRRAESAYRATRPPGPGVPGPAAHTPGRQGFSMHIKTRLEEIPAGRAVRHALGLAGALPRVLIAAAPQLRDAEFQVLAEAVRECAEILKRR